VCTGDSGGSTFRVILPRTEGAETPSVVPAEPTALRRGCGQRLLLVEDETATREGLAEVLELLGYRVTALGSAEEALTLAGEPGYDVLLTDLALPGLSGAGLGSRLQERWPGLGVIVMSGYAAETEVRRAVGEGHLRFLQKPFPMDVLARELAAVVAEGGGHAP
jgi:two-component system cell cycle sensor histidine kinase/response regulator CckA